MTEAPAVELDAQYRAMREQAGLLARPGRGWIALDGTEAADYLQGQLSNDVEGLAPGAGLYAALLDRKGHLQADMRVLRTGADEFLLDCEGIAAPALLKHLRTYKVGRSVEVGDRGSELALLSLIGPRSAELAGAEGLGPEHAHREAAIEGAPARAVATDLGVDLVLGAGEAESARQALLRAGAEAVSEDAAEILRVEAGRPRWGRELSEAAMPAEAGIVERAVDFEKGCYIGQEPVARLHYRGRPNRTLRGLLLEAPTDPGAELRLGERAVGTVATAVVSPAFGPIALALVRREAEPGDRLQVEGGGAEVAELPFGG